MHDKSAVRSVLADVCQAPNKTEEEVCVDVLVLWPSEVCLGRRWRKQCLLPNLHVGASLNSKERKVYCSLIVIQQLI